MKKDSVIDVDFEEWYALYDKYKEKDMGCKEVRESLEKDFTELSTKWWNVILSDFALEDNECSLDYCIAEIWFDGTDKFTDMKKVYDVALRRIYYCGDRMNLNRWFHIRWLLNLDKQ